MNKEESEAIEYYQDKEISFGVNFDTEKLLRSLGITEEDSFENHQIRFKTLLNLIEKLQKENEELEEINNKLEAEKNEAIRRYNFETIPKQKVKDKIEELNKAYEDSKDENGESEYYYPDYTIRVLEELLESE